MDETENYYLRGVLSGRGPPPVIASSPDGVKRFIKVIEGAIEYIDEGDVDGSVKFILINGRRLIR